MKTFLLATSLLTSAHAFAFVGKAPTKFDTALNSVGLYYSNSTGNSETVAGYIAKAAGGLAIEDIGDAKESDICKFVAGRWSVQ